MRANSSPRGMLLVLALLVLPACHRRNRSAPAQADHVLSLAPSTASIRRWSNIYTGLKLDYLVAESPHGGLAFVEDSVYWFSGDQLQLDPRLSKTLDESVRTGRHRADETVVVTMSGSVGIISLEERQGALRQELRMYRRERGFPTGFATAVASDLRSVTFFHDSEQPALTRFERLDDGSVLWTEPALPDACQLPPLSASSRVFDLGEERLLIADGNAAILVAPDTCTSLRAPTETRKGADMRVVASATGRPWALTRKPSSRKTSYQLHSLDEDGTAWRKGRAWTTQTDIALDELLTIADDPQGGFVFACHGHSMIHPVADEARAELEDTLTCPKQLRSLPGVGWIGWTETRAQTYLAAHPRDPPTPLTETFGVHDGSLAHLCLSEDELNLYTRSLDHLRWAWREQLGSWEFIDYRASTVELDDEAAEFDCGPKGSLRLLTTDTSIRALDRDTPVRVFEAGSRREGTFTSRNGLRAVTITSTPLSLPDEDGPAVEGPRRYRAIPVDVRETNTPASIELEGVRGPIIDGAVDQNGHFLLATLDEVHWYDGVGLSTVEFPDSAAADGAVLPRAVALTPNGNRALLAAFGSFVELEHERETGLWIPTYEPSMASSMIGEVWLSNDGLSAWSVDLLGHLHSGDLDPSGERRWLRRAEDSVLDFNLMRPDSASLADFRFPRITADADASHLALLSSGERLVVTRDQAVPRFEVELSLTADERLGGQLRLTGAPADLAAVRIESIDLLSGGERERVTPTAPIVEVSEDAQLIKLDRQLDDRLAGSSVTLELRVELDVGGGLIIPLTYSGTRPLLVPALPELEPAPGEGLAAFALPAALAWLLLNALLLLAMLGSHSFRRHWLTHWGPALLSLLGSKVLVKPLLTGVPPLTRLALRNYRTQFLSEHFGIGDFVEPRLSEDLSFAELVTRIEDPEATGIIWLLGPSGVGKSTVLAHLAHSARAPVMLMSLGFGKLPQRIAVHLRDYGDLPLTTPEAARLVSRGRYVILLDALNELTEQGLEGEQELHDHIEQLIRNNLVIITSQTKPYWQRHLPGIVASVLDFSDEQAGEFIGAETLAAIDLYLGYTFPRRPLLISFLRDYLEAHDRSPDYLVDVFESRFAEGLSAETLEAITATAKQTFLDRHLEFASTPRLPLQACDALRKLGVITKSGGLYRFAHQQIRAFFVARRLFDSRELELTELCQAHRDISVNSWGDVFEFLGELTAKYRPDTYEQLMWTIADVSALVYIQRIYPQSRRLHDTLVVEFSEDYAAKHSACMRRVAEQMAGTSY